MPIEEHPARMTLTDLQTTAEADRGTLRNWTTATNAATIEVMFNPKQLNRKLAANYARKDVLGNTHSEMEYLNTSNQAIDFDLFYNVETVAHLQQSIDAMNFLESLLYAKESPEGIAEAAPPRVMLVWPNTLAITTRLLGVEFNHQRFNRFGYTIQWTAKCTWEEARVRRLNKADVRAFGSMRTPESVLEAADAAGELIGVQFSEDTEGVTINEGGDTEIVFDDEFGGVVVGGEDP